MKKLAVLILLLITCLSPIGSRSGAGWTVSAQRKGNERPKKKEPAGPPVVREKKPPPPPPRRR